MVAQFERRKNYGGSSAMNNLPPQNIEAEEVVLGGILLDPGAMAAVLAVPLEPREFYIPAHREIFQTCYDLFREGLPTDLMTVTARLYDHGFIDRIGGQSKLAQLVDRTISAVNIDLYAKLIKEKFARREIIRRGNEIIQSGYDSYKDLEQVMGAIEQHTAELISLPVEKKADQFLEWQCSQVIDRVRKLEMGNDLPAVKLIKKQRLAEEFGFRSAKILDEIYMSSLTAEEYEPAMTLDELKEKYGHDDSPNWLQHGFLPSASVVLFHALGGDGKTLLSYFMASLLARGETWGEFTPTAKKRKVLVVQVDEPAQNLIMRAEQLELGDCSVKFISKWQVESIPYLVKEIENFGAEFVIIDSITGASKFSVYSENDVPFARPLLLLRDIAQDKNITFLVIHHSSKGAEGRGGSARGTSALVNAASEVWSLSRIDPKDKSNAQRIWGIDKSRSRRPCNYLIELVEDCRWEFLGEYQGNSIKEEPEAPLRQRILSYLESRPNVYYKAEDLGQELGYEPDSLRKVLSALRADGLIAYIPGKSGKNGYPSRYCFKMLITGQDFDHGSEMDQNDGSEISHTQSDFSFGGILIHEKNKKIISIDRKKTDFNGSECQESGNPCPEQSISDPPILIHESQNTDTDQNTIAPQPQPEIEELLSQVKEAIARKDSAYLIDFEEAQTDPNMVNQIWIELDENEVTEYWTLINQPEKDDSELARESLARINDLKGTNRTKFDHALTQATREELTTALEGMRSKTGDRYSQIQERLTKLTTGQGTLI